MTRAAAPEEDGPQVPRPPARRDPRRPDHPGRQDDQEVRPPALSRRRAGRRIGAVTSRRPHRARAPSVAGGRAARAGGRAARRLAAARRRGRPARGDERADLGHRIDRRAALRLMLAHGDERQHQSAHRRDRPEVLDRRRPRPCGRAPHPITAPPGATARSRARRAPGAAPPGPSPSPRPAGSSAPPWRRARARPGAAPARSASACPWSARDSGAPSSSACSRAPTVRASSGAPTRSTRPR